MEENSLPKYSVKVLFFTISFHHLKSKEVQKVKILKTSTLGCNFRKENGSFFDVMVNLSDLRITHHSVVRHSYPGSGTLRHSGD